MALPAALNKIDSRTGITQHKTRKAVLEHEIEDSKDKGTSLSEDRTLLSNERTFSSWMGTGLACVGVAIGLQAVFGSTDPKWLAKLVASIFLVTALAIFWAAVRQACKTYSRLNDSDVEVQGAQMFQRIATIMSIGTLGVGVVLWII